jgi:hypothetical protein
MRRADHRLGCEGFWLANEMIALSDNQLQTLMIVAADITPEKRSMFLERVSAMLALRGRGHFTDADVTDVASLALCGLVHHTPDAA